MDFPDFSLHEQRRLAEIERELSVDRRLVAMMEVLGSHRTTAWRRMRCFGIRVRRPAARTRRQSTPRSARIAVIIALCLMVAAPALLITTLIVGLATLSVVAACALPLPPVILAITHYRVNRSRGGRGAPRES
jgi:hypothetical protein